MRRLIICVILVLLPGCSTGQGGSATTSPPGPSTSSPSSAADVNGRYDVGGYELTLNCQGAGEPTVVYLHGLGGQARM